MFYNFILNKNLFYIKKKINKKFLKIFKIKFKKTKIKKNIFFIKISINKKNLFKKKIKINNLIQFLLLKFFLIKKYSKKIFYFLKKILFKKKFLSKKKFLFLNNFNLYKNKIKIFFFIHIKKKLLLIKNFFIILFKNYNFFLKQLMNDKIIKLIIYLLFLKKQINKNIISNNFKILKNIIKKYKKKPIYNDLYQECFLEFKKIITISYNYKNFFKFCYWKIKKKMIRIINSKKINSKSELISMDKPLFYHSLKYFLSERERFFLLEYTRESLKNLIRELILSLPQREQKIIRLRFGIGHNKNYTLEEIGFLHSLTKERIRQIELAIILKIRKPIIIELLEPYVKLLKALE
ncbi:sigma-70 family RNA polymerase sigma factor [Candidatus Carsonella ruddii]|uniref:sigma-70 family RNA polymerase sigma factor n=1 Tax=Carsonella ruddii TaxID=114186 RepID=UPI003D464660